MTGDLLNTIFRWDPGEWSNLFRALLAAVVRGVITDYDTLPSGGEKNQVEQKTCSVKGRAQTPQNTRGGWENTHFREGEQLLFGQRLTALGETWSSDPDTNGL